MKKATKISHALALWGFFIVVIIGFSKLAHADCPYDQTRNVYDCTGTIVEPTRANPSMASPGQYDARSSSMIERGNGWGGRRRGGCAAVLKSGTISHYDCTTQALEAVPGTIQRAQYQTSAERLGWNEEDEEE